MFITSNFRANFSTQRIVQQFELENNYFFIIQALNNNYKTEPKSLFEELSNQIIYPWVILTHSLPEREIVYQNEAYPS